jgi:hypothetical protein
MMFHCEPRQSAAYPSHTRIADRMLRQGPCRRRVRIITLDPDQSSRSWEL